MRRLAWLLLSLGLAGSLAAQTPARLFMWKATGKGAVVYLLGSVHLASPRLYPLPADMEKAFDQSSRLVVEADETKMDQGTVTAMALSTGMETPPDTIESHLSPQTIAALHTYLQSGSGGQAGQMIEMMKPWLAAVTISTQELQKHGFDPNQGIDRHFMQEATRSGKPIEQLESADFQLKLISGFSDKLQDEFLYSALDELPHLNDEFANMMSAWSSGNEQAMESVVFAEDRQHPEMTAFDTELIDNRNVSMDSKIEQQYMSRPGTTFVVVGSAHLIGPKGIVSLLQRHGYTVEQVTRGSIR
ncbi:MAG: TraB/GumN family protein [Candidatus Xenobia bacterium]